jgi:hypothetical protein
MSVMRTPLRSRLPLKEMEQRMMPRLHSKHQKTFQERLTEEAQRLKDEAERIPHGTARDLLLRRARQAETASHMDGWLSSPELRPPK